jgi:hypothetical protein
MNSLSIVGLCGQMPRIDLKQPPISPRRLGADDDGKMRVQRLIGDNAVTFQ